MSDNIKSSLEKIRLLESQQLSEASAAAAPVAQAAGKGLGRYVIPGVGAALGAQDAYSRYKKGDYAGAAISGVGAAASLIPGIGGLVGGLGSAGLNAMRDKSRTGSYFPDEEEQAAAAKDKAAQPAQQTATPAAKVPPGGDPKVFALQQQLIAKGAKISADGKMGPQTQAAMKQFPDVQLASKVNKVKGKIMSESEKIAALRQRLAQLEQPAEQLTEAPIGSAISAIKNFGKGAAAAFKGGAAASQAAATGTKATDAGMKAVQTVKAAPGAAVQAVKNNPMKAAAGAALTGVGAGYMAGKPGAAPAQPPVGGKPAAPKKAPAAPTNALPDPKEVEELNKLAAELENSQDPQDIALMKQYNGIINAINNRAAGDKRTQGEIAASADLKDAGM